jgi:hypothetical protein
MARSRKGDHEQIDALINEPGTDKPLSPLKRRQLHEDVDERWDRVKGYGARQLKDRNAALEAEETRLIARYEQATEYLAESLEDLANGEVTTDQVTMSLTAHEQFFNKTRQMERAYLERVEAASSEPTDPEEFAAGAQEELSRTFPALWHYGRDPFNVPAEEAS